MSRVHLSHMYETHSHRATKRCLSSNAGLLPVDAFFRYLFHNAKHHTIEAVESVYYTCSSGRDKSSIQACSKSGDVLCCVCCGGGGSGPGERVAGGRAGCSGEIMGTETAVVSKQTEAFCQINTKHITVFIQLKVKL